MIGALAMYALSTLLLWFARTISAACSLFLWLLDAFERGRFYSELERSRRLRVAPPPRDSTRGRP